MHVRGIRAALLAIGLVVGAVAATACTPPPPPPPPVHTLCSASATPAAGAQVALVTQGGTRPAVVKFQAKDQSEVSTKVAQLNQTGHVIAVGPDQPVHAQVVNNPGQNPDYTPFQIDFQPGEVNFPAAWNGSPPVDGQNVRVAVVDTGVDASHLDLAANVTIGNDLVFGNGSSNFARVDGYGHGTHVAGTIAAVDNEIGVIGGAPHATIVPVRVLDCQGSGSTSTVAAGVEWASDPTAGAAKVINLSLGGEGADPVLAQAIQDALARHVVVVAAAGNSSGSPTDHFDVVAKNAASAPAGAALAGQTLQVQVTAVLPSGHVDTGYARTVHFISSDSAATLPADQTLTNGVGTFPFKLQSSGVQTVAATDDAGGHGTSNTIAVTALSDRLGVFVPSGPGAVQIQVAALTPTGSVDPIYTGTVHFQSSDSSATLPSDRTLTSGSGTFTATFATGGLHTVTATDTVSPAITGRTNDAIFPVLETPEYPGAFAGQPGFQGLLAVGALNPSNRIANFSNDNDYVTVAAPGVSILSTVPSGGTSISDATGYTRLSGTSMATPHVAAVAALLLQKCPNDTPAQIEASIVGAGHALPVPFDFVSGAVPLLRAEAVVNPVSCS